MKKIIFILAIVMLNCWFSGCTKADVPSSDSLMGKWELTKTIGGWSGIQQFPTGNGNILVFTGNHYERYENNRLTDSGTYKTYKDQSALLQKTMNRIEYIPASVSTRYFFEYSGDELIITMDVYDGVTSYYRKSGQ